MTRGVFAEPPLCRFPTTIVRALGSKRRRKYANRRRKRVEAAHRQASGKPNAHEASRRSGDKFHLAMWEFANEGKNLHSRFSARSAVTQDFPAAG